MVHTPWLVACHLVQLFYMSFHLSVAAVISTQIALRNESFCKGFYVLYVIQSFFDCCCYAFTTVLRTFTYTATSPDFLSHSSAGIAFYAAVGFCIASQESCHVAIAFNRYTAFKYLQNHKQLWMGRYLGIAVALSFAIAIVSASPRLFADPFVTSMSDSYTILNLNRASYVATFASLTVIVLGTTITCFCLEIRSYLTYRAMPLNAQRNHRDDFRLLGYAICQLAAQLLIALHYCSLIATKGTSLATPFMALYPYMNSFLSISSSTCLLVTSKLVRRQYLKVCTFGRYDGSKAHVTPTDSFAH